MLTPKPRLIGLNALSLALALIANMALLFNMARRLPFSIAQPITIIGWYLSSFLLIGLVVAASYAPSMQLPPESNPALTGAFYYAIMAAGLYVIVASLMVVTVWGAHQGHYSKTFELTMSQRTLMLQTIAYLVYLLGGAAVYAHIENWLFLNGVWWANYTLLTIGIGDFHVVSNLGKGLLFPYAIGGIVVLGLVVGSIRSLVLERGKEKLAARLVEKKREKVLQKVSDSDSEVRVSHFSRAVTLRREGDSEQRRRRNEFRLMRKIQEHAETRRKWTSLILSVTAWLILWFVGAAVFYVAERDQQGMSYFQALYFAYTSLLTIGYGDYTLLSNSGKAAFVFWSLLAVPTLTILISNMGDTVIKGIRDVTLWLGAFTVLPGENSATGKVKAAAQKVKNSHGSSGEKPAIKEEQPGGADMPQEDRDLERAHEGRARPPDPGTTKASERLGEEYEREELDEAEVAKARGDRLSEDAHLYHYLLVKEIRKVMKDTGEEPPKKYGYGEWAWFMRLLGEDEGDTKYHRRAPSAAPDADEMQTAAKGAKSAASSTPWSWVGERSPLMGETNEAEWVLERLSERLEGQLRAERDKSRKEKKDKRGDAPESGGEAEGLKSPATIGEEDEKEALDRNKRDVQKDDE